MGADLVVLGVVLLVVGLVIVPEVVDEVVPPGVDRVVKSVEHVVMAIVNRKIASLPSTAGRIEDARRSEDIDDPSAGCAHD